MGLVFPLALLTSLKLAMNSSPYSLPPGAAAAEVAGPADFGSPESVAIPPPEQILGHIQQRGLGVFFKSRTLSRKLLVVLADPYFLAKSRRGLKAAKDFSFGDPRYIRNGNGRRRHYVRHTFHCPC